MEHAHRPALSLVWLVAAITTTDAAASIRYKCVLPDGSVRVMAQNPAASYARSFQQCTPFEITPDREPEAGPTLQQRAFDFGAALALAQARERFLEEILAGANQNTLPVQPAGATPIRHMVYQASHRRGLDPLFVMAVIQVESGYQAKARSPKGALGLMQIMPATGARFGIDSPRALLDPAVNIDVGTRYLRWLTDHFDGRLDLILAAYNAGEGAVARHGNRVPPYRETREYVRKILDLYSPAASPGPSLATR